MTFTSLFAPVKIRSSIFHKTSKASLKWRRSSGLQWLWRRWCVTRWNCSFFIHTAQSSSSYMHLNRTTALLEGNHHQLHLRRRSLDTILTYSERPGILRWRLWKLGCRRDPGLPTATLSGTFWLRGMRPILRLLILSGRLWGKVQASDQMAFTPSGMWIWCWKQSLTCYPGFPYWS